MRSVLLECERGYLLCWPTKMGNVAEEWANCRDNERQSAKMVFLVEAEMSYDVKSSLV
jgi:hypothetical protein